MIKREISTELLALVDEYPVVTILGPRQSGKTTLAQAVLPNYTYSNLELPETRELATQDPKAYLANLARPAIIDEIQRVPQLLSYVQVLVDDVRQNGQFVLTGSHQLQVREAITQSLAGRTAILHLLPFSIHELERSGTSFDTFEQYAYQGFLPRIYDHSLRPTQAYSNYYQTYVERDIRQLIHLRDASRFEALLKLLAGRVGQVLDYSSLANDVGVDAKTVRHWISILEASFILIKLPPYFENFGKRVIKSPKYYFMDVGLLCFLLGIRKPEQVRRDPLVGGIFENLVVTECLKTRYSLGEMPDLYFFRDSNGNEVDLVSRTGPSLVAAEIKSATTFSFGFLKGLKRMRAISGRVEKAFLLYNGDEQRLSDGTVALNFRHSRRIFQPDA